MNRVLIVDDDEAVCRATQIALEANGFNVTTANGGKAGIEAVQRMEFDVAIVDLFMEDMDGLETAKAMRAHSPKLGIIAASGFMFGGNVPDMPGFETMALEAGANLTLYKPYRPKDLVQAIGKAVAAAAA